MLTKYRIFNLHGKCTIAVEDDRLQSTVITYGCVVHISYIKIKTKPTLLY